MRSTAPLPGIAAISRREFAPLLAPLWSQRKWCAGIAAAGFLQVAAVRAGFQGLTCPFHEFTGVACPGCGLTTAMVHFCRGEWLAGITSHAFAPLFMIGIAGSLVMAALPDGSRDRTLESLMRFERRSGVMPAAGAGLMLYWVFRVVGH
jgi:hypothetical protein